MRNSKIRRLFEWIRWPPPYEGPILAGRIDGFAYLIGWAITFAHLALAAGVFILGLDKPWPLVSTLTSVVGTLFLLTIVIVIHRRLGNANNKLPLHVVWQWWLGPWDSVGRVVWLPVRLNEAARVIVHGPPVEV